MEKESLSNGPVHLLFVIIVNLLGPGAFSRDFRAFSKALQTGKLKVPLFPSLIGAGTINDWCIMYYGDLIHLEDFPPFLQGDNFCELLFDFLQRGLL